ncbi:MAG: thiol:disulfide interchange protein [Betaproteobacteria bacterium RBG_16_58_11]|nr:MAG: thiol:disulfide interchange protein [Betaproteobacteria bacterium RBG_16_58_11]OGA00701.1 MAG: thiol:disulfide interchange protein [Betaproteobacteria bacterium RBG_19FT_COMBO_58_11]
MLRFLVPFALFVALIIFFAIGLNRDPREIPSPLINQAAPAFTLQQLQAPAKQFSPADMRGQVWLLNVWASWCVSCRDEHPVLVDLAKRNLVPIVGLNYKDQRPDALQWLAQFGNPYVLSVTDFDGRIGIDYGVYGVPETYVIDKQGVIRMKHIGPVTPQVLQDKILPKVRELSK